MSKDLLNFLHRGPGHRCPRGGRVAKVVPREIFNPSFLDGRIELPTAVGLAFKSGEWEDTILGLVRNRFVLSPKRGKSIIVGFH